MAIKTWLSKNFVQQMRWSSARDYPPKRKKAWLYNNFMGMEEIHSDHMTEVFNDFILPLPPTPVMPQTPEGLEPDPCAGPRTLWIIANPSTVDCDSSTSITLIWSGDFKCTELQQLFFDEDKPHIVYGGGRTLEYPVNVKDITGGLEIEETCADTASITVAAIDCECGGRATVDIFLNNCGADCGTLELIGPTALAGNSSAQYYLLGAQGNVTWSLLGGAAGVTITEGGFVTVGVDSCGVFTVQAEDDCCGGGYSLAVLITTNGVWIMVDDICHTAKTYLYCTEDTGTGTKTIHGYWCQPYSYCWWDDEAPCATECAGQSYRLSIRDYEWQCPP